MKTLLLFLTVLISLPSIKSNQATADSNDVDVKKNLVEQAPGDVDSSIYLNLDAHYSNEVFLSFREEHNQELNITHHMLSGNVEFLDNSEESELSLKLLSDKATLDFTIRNDEETISKTLYLQKYSNLTFTSEISEEDLKKTILDYQLENNIIETVEYDSQIRDLFSEAVTSSVGIVTYATAAKNRRHGHLYWYDDRLDTNQADDSSYNLQFRHPLGFIKVELWESDALLNKDDHFGTTYTDENGYFDFYYDNTDTSKGADIYLKIFAEGRYFKVTSSSNYNPYSFTTAIEKDMANNTTLYKSKSFKMVNTLGEAMQVAAATGYNSEYMNYLHGGALPIARVKYPTARSNGAYYDGSVNIPGVDSKYPDSSGLHGYSSWDVIGHEYGHFIQDKFGISNSPGGGHDGTNHTDVLIRNGFSYEKARRDGVWLAWGEGWPTYNSTLAQIHFNSILINIPYVGDYQYTAYNNTSYSLLYAYSNFKGEASEIAVSNFLMELVVDIGISNEFIYSLIISNRVISLSYFAYLLRVFYNDTNRLGQAFERFGISPSNLRKSTDETFSNPPTFTWNADGGSINLPHDNFSLVILDINGKIIELITDLKTTSYKLSANQWSNVLRATGTDYFIYVIGKTTQYMETGPYNTRWYAFSKPSQYNNQHQIKQSDYGFEEWYPFDEQGPESHYVDGLSFQTTRLRAGYIEDEYVVLSPTREGAGEAYIEYHFSQPVTAIDVELAFWSNEEGELLSAAAEYKDAAGNWTSKLDLLNDITLSYNRKSPKSYKMVFNSPITSFRFISTADVSGELEDWNRGRICIGNMIISRNPTTSKIEIVNADYNFKKDSYDPEIKSVTVSGTQFSVSKSRSGDIQGFTVLSPRRSGFGTASIEYNFAGKEVYQVDFDLAHWREEGKFDNILIQYWDDLINDFVTKTTINYNELPFDKTTPKTFSTFFDIPVSKFRILATAPATGNGNDGRIVLAKTTITLK